MRKIISKDGEMENTTAINLLFVESGQTCSHKDCNKPCRVIDTKTGVRFCEEHAPVLWIEQAFRNGKRIEYERKAIPRACVRM